MRSSDHAREPHSPSSSGLPRRDWIAGAGCLLATLGCRPGQPSEDSASRDATIHSDVPLRILWMGRAADATVLERTWASISEQPLDIRLLEPPRDAESTDAPDDPSPLQSQEYLKQSSSADVLLYPVSMMGELVTNKRIMPLLANASSEESLGSTSADQHDTFRGLDRSSLPITLRLATTFAGEQMATPLGGRLPALMLGENSSDESIQSWSEYADFVESSGGKCAEPTALGWAGAMYLWRLASSLQTTWLFDRETLAPLLTLPEYVAVLQQMRAAVQKSSPEFRDLAPGQIYRLVANGELQAGIGFPQLGPSPEDARDQVNGVIAFSALPDGGDDESKLGTEIRQARQRAMIDPFMLVGSLAASCRQTAAADAFLDWLSGGQGSEPLYRSIASLVDVTSPASESSVDMAERYRAWLSTQLSKPGYVPTLQLAGAVEYYNSLDSIVRDCVLGDTTAEVACQQINDQWNHLHHQYDLPSQKRMWRRALSMG
ncbi:ABC transporter substrate-binding protein [Allorhodopirellula heiligendammensis]|nr:ABC transporter substrate-binding protein [Allorhodopirellula heiligendammensis]